MKRPSAYRERAEECLLVAELMTDSQAKADMLEAAYHWKLLAEIAEHYPLPDEAGSEV